MAEPQSVDDKSFDKVVLEAKTPFLVDFWAPWCAPCRNIAPIVEELAKEFAGKVGFAKVNVDESSALATRYSVRSIPTLLFFKGGKPVNQIVGLRPKAELKKNLDSLLTDKG
ncbi:MAG: thioredoxin [Chloroflexi bacterium RBG_13_52_14]|nr:MAG: thioredoxin [Chloroflexi bacterium RBG_13_52_14]